MSGHNLKSVQTKPIPKSALLSYTAGFVLSVILTLLAYALLSRHVVQGWQAIYAVVGLAVVQLVVQLVFFLHLGHESEPRWNLLVFDFTLIIVSIVVVGSLWIMNNLHYTMTPRRDVEREIIQDEGYHK
jgi:cytochrome o ubiquinol oxidase operon protein cyoD